MTYSNGNIPVEVVDTEARLVEVAGQLKRLPEIAIDTEFDDFNTQYGVHLQLIQVFDGETCFLIDPLRITRLDSLWAVFESEATCKVIYSGVNDIGIFKRYGCAPRNIFDVQIAALLCNRDETSHAKLIDSVFGAAIDKSQQRSQWGNRPLKADQVVYASNDVIYLLRLKAMLFPELESKGLLPVLQEEQLAVEAAVKEDYFPKLTPGQKRMFSAYAGGIMMDFKRLVTGYAKALNVPPFYIVRDSLLEQVIKDKRKFLEDPFSKGFYETVAGDEAFKKQFLDIVQSIDTRKGWANRERNSERSKEASERQHNKLKSAGSGLAAFKQYAAEKYGELAGQFMLNGLAKIFSGEKGWDAAKQYQVDLYKDFLAGR